MLADLRPTASCLTPLPVRTSAAHLTLRPILHPMLAWPFVRALFRFTLVRPIPSSASTLASTSSAPSISATSRAARRVGLHTVVISHPPASRHGVADLASWAGFSYRGRSFLRRSKTGDGRRGQESRDLRAEGRRLGRRRRTANTDARAAGADGTESPRETVRRARIPSSTKGIAGAGAGAGAGPEPEQEQEQAATGRKHRRRHKRRRRGRSSGSSSDERLRGCGMGAQFLAGRAENALKARMNTGSGSRLAGSMPARRPGPGGNRAWWDLPQRAVISPRGFNLGAPRDPGNTQWGDWECEGCGGHNRRHRQSCFTCSCRNPRTPSRRCTQPRSGAGRGRRKS